MRFFSSGSTGSEIRNFLRIQNGLAKTVNLRYYMPKSVPDPGTGFPDPDQPVPEVQIF